VPPNANRRSSCEISSGSASVGRVGAVAGIPAAVTYRADGETERLVVIYPEIDGDVLDVWSLNERTYRRLELSRIDLDQGSTDVNLA